MIWNPDTNLRAGGLVSVAFGWTKMKERPYHHGDLRAALIALASEHVAREGVETLSVRALARAAGVAHRAAYQHFPDKDGLVAAVLVEAYRRLSARLAGAAAETGVEARLLSVARAYAAFAQDEPRMFLAMTGPRVNADGRQAALETALGTAWRAVAEPIAEGVTSGLFPSADKTLAAAVFWGGLVGVLAQEAQGRLKLAAPARTAFMDAVATRLIAGLKAP